MASDNASHWMFTDYQTCCSYNALVCDVFHDDASVSNPAVPSNFNFFVLATLLLDGFFQIIKIVLSASTQDVNSAANQSVFFYDALSDVALRSYINAFFDCRIPMR